MVTNGIECHNMRRMIAPSTVTVLFADLQEPLRGARQTNEPAAIRRAAGASAPYEP
ncbi:hypothetical protein tb265_19420 [Gemmatimonadetes bacterium T265]|nr:hypothetical protein tb265_19420 [Gemmatimonadetes bacterium T265]